MGEPSDEQRAADDYERVAADRWLREWVRIDDPLRQRMWASLAALLAKTAEEVLAERDREWIDSDERYLDRKVRADVLAEVRRVVEEVRKSYDKNRPLSVLRTTDQAVCDKILHGLEGL